MEEVIEELRETFKEKGGNEKHCKLSYAIGSLEVDKRVNKQQALEILFRILVDRL